MAKPDFGLVVKTILINGGGSSLNRSGWRMIPPCR